ncbi:two-component system chemotaxis response regulator CheY [Duganella sp. SG902]|uniref:response regulator n=1 Tax=Duganella sp. SG902 TaxID=2587016 RepID=UPI00159D6387|nr:response regulator [Duganella sp. SG902]NVM76455.1 two-component system chemotaxis response regulator CheY [Duganella sp. SG902]
MPAHQGLRVFIIDDNEMTRDLLRAIIQGDSYDVVGDAGTAESARLRLRSVRADIICLDVVMPDGDGLSLLNWIRVKQPEAEVLMVTASTDRVTVEQSLRNGAKGYIVKPFNPGTVMDTLDKIGAQIKARRAAGRA